MKICLNGKYIDGEEANISVYDNCFLSGYGVYETVRTYGGKMWQLGKHLERLRSSAQALDIPLNYSNEEMSQMVTELLEINGFRESRIRLTLSSGASKVYGGLNFKPNFVVMVEELKEVDADLLTNGVDLITYNMERVLPKVKSCNLLPNLLAIKAANRQNAYEALLVNGRDHVTEGAITNVFFAKAGKLITPKDDILLGTTRDLIIELAESADMEVEERTVGISELGSMQECFITNAPRGIVPVRGIINLEIKFNIAQGVTTGVQKLFAAYIDGFVSQD